VTLPGPVPQSNDKLQDDIGRIWASIKELGRKTLRVIRRDSDGSRAFDASGDTWLLFDKAENQLVADDASGVGLALPWIPIPTVSILGIPQTNIASYGVVASTLGFRKTSPYCSVTIYAQTQSGAVGNARVTINGVAVGAVLAVPATSTQTLTQNLALPGAVGDTITINVEVQVTNALGTIGAAFTATQRGTP